jgi:transcription-repair coupling factor (superfamily II helicase)
LGIASTTQRVELASVIDKALSSNAVRGFLDTLSPGANHHVAGLRGSGKALFVSCIRTATELPILVVLPTLESYEHFVDDLASFIGEEDLQRFPESEILPYEDKSPHWMETSERVRTLAELAEGDARVVVTTVKALSSRLPEPGVFGDETLKLSEGSSFSMEELVHKLTYLGYERTSIVEDERQFCVRGGLVDVSLPGSDSGIRIDFFGDQIDSIREFDIATQKSTRRTDSVKIIPPEEIILRPDLFAEAANILESRFPNDEDRFEGFLERVEGEGYFPGIEKYLPYFHRNASWLDTYLPDGTLAVVVDKEDLADRDQFLMEERTRLFEERKDHNPLLPQPDELWQSAVSILGSGKFNRRITFGFRGAGGTDKEWFFNTHLQESFNADINLVRERIVELSQTTDVSVICDNKGQVDRLDELLDLPAGMVSYPVARLSEGVIFPEAGVSILTDHQIFNRYRRRHKKKFKGGTPLSSFEDLAAGDLVVHEDHGIGRYEGILRMELDEGHVDCLNIAYAGADRLYVPVTEIDRVQKYVGKEGHTPRINTLGGAGWKAAKERAKKAIEIMAKELLELYATRASSEGFSFSKDKVWQRELEASFIYEETEDQLTAADEIKKDMEDEKPMDRLVCGDVGFGKTELAVRAAFKAVMDKKQVAVLVPTTILAEQHVQTFRERLAEFPVTVDVLSRFRSAKEQKKIIERLKDGTLDILIGTHRMLSSDVEFFDLGLVVIDEEQRFGVRHKEKLKQMKGQVDVLTLSATPIPRTLYMSLMGARDMSTISTPPRDRLPILTEIVPFDDRLIAETISREIERGGQVYFVHNRVNSIDKVEHRLSELLPGIRFAVGHGQMSERELEDVMVRFLNREIDVLVCSMIIEAGLDIPNVNTIIVNRADRFGLAQLYQLRGRVGRSSQRAYAYLLVPKGRAISMTARKRLSAIEEFSELSSGFKLAMRDLEIRGAGNILGAEQHGHMLAIGFNLYVKLLSEAVAMLKGEKRDEALKAQIHVDTDAYIPDSYIQDNVLKINVYKRIRDTRSIEQISSLEKELIDRFGVPPPEVRTLMDVQALRMLATRAGVAEVHARRRMVRLQFAPGATPARRQLNSLKSAHQGITFEAGPPDSLSMLHQGDVSGSIRGARKMLKALGSDG